MTAQASKYSMTWQDLKLALKIEVQLKHSAAYSPAQIERQLKTIRKAISKQKYEDWQYKRINPNAKISTVMDIDAGTIIFTLDPDCRDVSKLFE